MSAAQNLGRFSKLNLQQTPTDLGGLDTYLPGPTRTPPAPTSPTLRSEEPESPSAYLHSPNLRESFSHHDRINFEETLGKP